MQATDPNSAKRILKIRKQSDPFLAPTKLVGPAVCPHCAAAFKDGRWQWGSAPLNSIRVRCPACQRVKDQRPAAVVYVRNSLIMRRRDELFALIRNIESTLTQQHPLERVIGINDDNYATSIVTTGVQIAERVAQAIADVTQTTITTRVGDGTTTLVVA